MVYQEYEKRWIFRVLIFVAGFYGGYAMLVRGGAFSNAQTGNVALMAIELGKGNWQKALYFLIPISAYLLGTMTAELMPRKLRGHGKLHWSTLLPLLEMVMVILMGFIPATAPHQICQVIISFTCAMQYHTFPSAEGDAMATTFCTNLIRQIGAGLAKTLDDRQNRKKYLKKAGVFAAMVLFFALGVFAATISIHWLGTYAIWLNLLPLTVIFVDLLRADLHDSAEMKETSC